jgi:penicillin-binding protein 1B
VVSNIDTKNPAMLLGAVDLSPIEMADAYSTIARVGSRVPLHAVKFVTDDRNRILSTGDEIKPVQVFPARDMYILLNVMKGVVDRGTGATSRSMGFRLTAAGKTGTTNDKRDAWFIGFTPKTLTLTWLGFDDNQPTGLSGGTGAVPIWTRFMQVVTAGQPNAGFAAPAGITMAQIDETSGGLAVPNCPPNAVVSEAFKAGTEPVNPCSLHSPQVVPPPALDQFGNPIALDTAGMPVAPEAVTGTQELPPITPEPGETTLTGGFGRTDTSTPPTTSTEPRRDRPEPPPSTNTDEPSTTTTTSTAPPPPR